VSSQLAKDTARDPQEQCSRQIFQGKEQDEIEFKDEEDLQRLFDEILGMKEEYSAIEE